MVPEVRLARLNQRYGPALAVARLVLERRSLDFGDGPTPGQAFLVNMHVVFERFLTAAVGRALRPHGGTTLAPHVTKLDTAGAVDVRPDLVWRRHGQVRAVIDAKYESLTGLTGPSGDMYQTLAYCVAHDLPRCWLVYAAGNETSHAHALRHLDATVHVATVDLQGSIEQLHSDVQALIDRFVDPP